MKLASAERRRDIQGIRALAILSVVVYHVDSTWLPGGFIGVDIFFVLSGFLITGIWLKGTNLSRRAYLIDFWSRRILRLLPAASVVLIVTAIAAGFILPAVERRHIAAGITAATLYFANWFYANDSLDYLAEDVTSSPVLHFWSLGVEEQFYIVWPLLFLIILGFAKPARYLRWALAILVVSSFVYSMWMSYSEQPLAFFGTPARMWQLGAGALIAVWSEQLSRIWPRVRLIIAYASMVLIVIALFGMDSFINAGYPYPGIPSLLPTIGAAGLIVAGLGGILKSLVSGFLSSWPMQAIGEVSYSWYLWHWPFLVFAKVLWPEINSQQLMWVALSALVVATISLYVVENPVRYAEFFKSKPLRTYSLAVGLMGATLMSSYWLGTQDAVELEKNTVISYSPTASEAVNDIPALYDLGCMNTSTAAWVNIEKQCIFGDLDGDRIAVLYGDSHAAHWFGGLNEAAKAQGVQLHLRLKSFCTPVDVARWDENRRQVYAECEVWKERVLENLTDLQPDFIFWGARSSGSISVVKNGEQIFGRDETRIWRNSLKRTMQDLLDTGAKVIAIADNPFAPYSMPGCVSENPGEPNLCNFSRKEGGLSRFDLPALRAVPDVVVVDFVDRFCSKQECFAVVDDTFVYRDMGHITDTFSRTFVTDFVALLSEPVTS